jgi:hypothetical protein
MRKDLFTLPNITAALIILLTMIMTGCGGGEPQAASTPPNMKVIRGCVMDGDKPGCFKIINEQDKQTYSFKHPGAVVGTYVELVSAAPHAGDCDDKNQIGVSTVTVISDKCSGK